MGSFHMAIKGGTDMTRDMTTGNPAKIILSFTLPIFIGNVFQQLYSMADTVIVGRLSEMKRSPQ